MAPGSLLPACGSPGQMPAGFIAGVLALWGNAGVLADFLRKMLD